MPEPRQSSAAVYRFISHLDNLKTTTNGYEASCPGPIHKKGDRHASLSVSEGYDGRVILKCHAGCSTQDVVGALGLSLSDLFEKREGGPKRFRFRVLTPHGTATHVREDLPNGEKKIRWEGLNGTPLAELPLYGADELPAEPTTVYITEGEKACEALRGARPARRWNLWRRRHPMRRVAAGVAPAYRGALARQ
jgi:hypothetical protein